jgi:hypothetical protein
MSCFRDRLGSLIVTLVCATASVGCDSSATGSLDAGLTGWDAGNDPLAIRLPIEDGSAVFACGSGFAAAEVEADLIDAITSAPKHCQGSQGNYVCSCGRVMKESYAFTCPAALLEACATPAERVDGSGDAPPVPTKCAARSRELSGSCAVGEDDQLECSCDDDGPISTTPVPANYTQASCDQALFAACGGSCEDEFGACTTSDSGIIGEYECACTTNNFTHLARAASCQTALLSACNPLNEAEDVCTGYGGYCDAIDRVKQTELTCTCIDRTMRTVEHVPASQEPRFRACRETLEATCGLGEPPEGAQCVAEGNGYHARCTRGPSEDAALTCECYADGDIADVRVERVEDNSCDMATLAAFCPEIAD